MAPPRADDALGIEVAAIVNATGGRTALLQAVDGGGRTILHRVARVNRADLAKLLVEAGSDPNAQDFFCYTPLDAVLQTGIDNDSEVGRYLESVGGVHNTFH